jgi:cyclic pyranopterin phosphate synthase
VIAGGGNLQGTLDGIDAASAAGLAPIKLNMVVLRDLNDHEIEDFAKLTFHRDIMVRFIEYVPMFGQENNWLKHYIPSEEIMIRCSRIAPMKALPEEHLAGPAKGYHFAGAVGWFGFITPISQHFCSQCNRLRLTSDGKLKPCLFSGEEIDLVPALASGGDVVRHFREAAMRKPEQADASPASQGASCGPRGMVEIGG